MDGVIDLSSLSLPHQNYQVNIINIFSSFYFIFPRKIIEIVKGISAARDIFLRVFRFWRRFREREKFYLSPIFNKCLS